MAQRVEEQARQGDKQGLRIQERRQAVKARVKDHLPKNVARMEARAERMERRVKKIEENPDPTKPAANKILYKNQANAIRRLINAWKTGNPPFVGERDGLGWVMGFEAWGAIGAADRSTYEEAKRYFDIMERQGFNSNSCDRTIAIIPMILTGEYPPPAFITTSNFECYPIYLANQSLANLLGVPLLSVDRPPVWNEEAMAYMVRQVEEEIDYLQTMFPGHKYNEAMLAEQQECAKQWWVIERDIHKLRRRKPCALAGLESFREIGPPGGDDMWEGLEYRRLYRDQLYEKADKGEAPSKIWGTEEKLRLCWAVSGPYFYDPFTFLDKLGVSVPIWLWSDNTEKKAGREPVVGDEASFGRKLTPLEEVARGRKFGWGDRSHYYVNSIISTARELELDGIVYFKQIGCSPTMPLGGIVAERAERELGIPTIELEGRQLDQRGFNERDLLGKLVDFSNVCLARKHLPPLSQKDLERAGYTDGSYNGWR